METTENCLVYLAIVGQVLTRVKIPKSIIHQDSLSPELFVIALMPRKYIVQKCRSCDQFKKSLEKINHRMHNNIKILAKNEKYVETLIKISDKRNK